MMWQIPKSARLVWERILALSFGRPRCWAPWTETQHREFISQEAPPRSHGIGRLEKPLQGFAVHAGFFH